MQVKDLEALKAVCAEAGAVFVEGKRNFEWYGHFLNDWSSQRAAVNRVDPKTFGKCEHVIKVPGVAYEIGVVKRADGDGYDLLYDSYGSGRQLEAKFGEGLPLLKQAYGVEVSKRELSRKGYRVTTTKQADGSIRLHATGGR
jgi:hypothetical protein